MSGGDSAERSLWEALTTWHYEGRQRRNQPVPQMNEAVTSPEWVLMTPSETRFHDNGAGKPETKFIHRDGREVVFDGDTSQIVSDPEFVGTYNYITPYSRNEVDSLSDEARYAIAGIGHWIVDVIPFKLLGATRPN